MAFTPCSAPLAGQLSGLSRRTGSIVQVKQLQQLVAKAAQDPETPIRFVAGLLRAYVDLDEIAMAKQGIGRPKPVEARNANTKRKHHTRVEPLRRSVSEPQVSDTSSTSQSATLASPAGPTGQS